MTRRQTSEQILAEQKKSESRLVGVHPDLVAVVRRAIEITEIDFTVLEGVRTLERQKQLVAEGSSTTMRSRHLTGHAIDLAALGQLGETDDTNGKWQCSEAVRWAKRLPCKATPSSVVSHLLYTGAMLTEVQP